MTDTIDTTWEQYAELLRKLGVDRIIITEEHDCGTHWRLWVPPTRPEHTDGGRPDDPILGLYGDTYWPTLAEALAALDMIGVA